MCSIVPSLLAMTVVTGESPVIWWGGREREREREKEKRHMTGRNDVPIQEDNHSTCTCTGCAIFNV